MSLTYFGQNLFEVIAIEAIIWSQSRSLSNIFHISTNYALQQPLTLYLVATFVHSWPTIATNFHQIKF